MKSLRQRFALSNHVVKGSRCQLKLSHVRVVKEFALSNHVVKGSRYERVRVVKEIALSKVRVVKEFAL